jgi:hypothetical protein
MSNPDFKAGLLHFLQQHRELKELSKKLDASLIPTSPEDIDEWGIKLMAAHGLITPTKEPAEDAAHDNHTAN